MKRVRALRGKIERLPIGAMCRPASSPSTRLRIPILSLEWATSVFWCLRINHRPKFAIALPGKVGHGEWQPPLPAVEDVVAIDLRCAALRRQQTVRTADERLEGTSGREMKRASTSDQTSANPVSMPFRQQNTTEPRSRAWHAEPTTRRQRVLRMRSDTGHMPIHEHRWRPDYSVRGGRHMNVSAYLPTAALPPPSTVGDTCAPFASSRRLEVNRR